MGNTLSYGLVYGIPLEVKGQLAEDADEAIDIEFLIEDNYSLLQYDYAGYNHSNGGQSIVTIAGMGSTNYNEPMMDVGSLVKKAPSKEAMEQLEAFCSKYEIACTPSWYVHASYG